MVERTTIKDPIITIVFLQANLALFFNTLFFLSLWNHTISTILDVTLSTRSATVMISTSQLAKLKITNCPTSLSSAIIATSDTKSMVKMMNKKMASLHLL